MKEKVGLATLMNKFNETFGVEKLDKDPAMGRFLPMVYEKIGFDWRNFFEPDFTSRFNGLMIKGDDLVGRVFCAVFPSPDVISRFLTQANSGDLLFLHHPIDMECGNPEGKIGAGFLPINPELLNQIKSKKLSIYTCHAPLDCHSTIGTSVAIMETIEGKLLKEFLAYGNGNAGRICSILPLSTEELINEVKVIFGVILVDFAGKKLDKIETVAVVPGGGDDQEAMEEAENLGAQAYLTGEIHSHHSWEQWGKQNTEKVNQYMGTSAISFIGVSHAASEFLVMPRQIVSWIEKEIGVKASVIPQSEWWR